MVILYIAVGLLVSVLTAKRVARRRRARRAGRNPMAKAFSRREFRQFDKDLEAVAEEELRRLEKALVRYLATRAGHVVAVAKAPNGIALELSDGCHLALRGISSHAAQVLARYVQVELLRPESVHRDALSYHLLLRGDAGSEISIHARNVALAA